MLYWQGASFTNNFTPASQIGQLFWQYYRYTGDKDFLRERAYPFMKKAAEVYLQYLKWDEAKKEYFIFPASPYECEGGNQFKNTLTDLGMINVSFRTCIEASQMLGVDGDKRNQWQRVLDHLPAYPLANIPETGEVLAVALDKDGNVVKLSGGDGETCC